MKLPASSLTQPLVALITAVLLLTACGGDAVQPAAPPVPPTGQPPEPVPPPVIPPTTPVPPATPTPVPDPVPDPLATWFQGGIVGKRVVFWGNSTVSNAVYFFDQLLRHAVTGGTLQGLSPAQVLNYGSNGASLAAMLNGQGAYAIGSVIAASPDLLVIRGPLINDVRLGGTTLEQVTARLDTALQQIRAGTPRTAILLTTENSLLAADPGGQGWVQPATAAQQYTDILHAAVMAFDGRYPNVAVLDVMAGLYGTISPQSSPWMADQLHPNEAGQRAEAELIAQVIGVPQPDTTP